MDRNPYSRRDNGGQAARDMYTDAVTVQNAVNPAGIAYDLWRVICAAREELSEQGPDIDTRRGLSLHPAVVLFYGKLGDLLGYPGVSTDQWVAAFDEAKHRSPALRDGGSVND